MNTCDNEYINQLAKVCLEDASPAGLLKARDMMYNLLSNCIPADVIITHLAKELIRATDDAVKHEIAYWAAYYENRLHQGNKDIFHLEAFVAKVHGSQQACQTRLQRRL